MRTYRMFAGWVGEAVDTFLSQSDDQEHLLNNMIDLAQGVGQVGRVFEIRDHEGTALHRIEIQMVYTVNPHE